MLPLELADEGEEGFDLLVRQHSRRLVQNENARFAGQRLGDLHHLLMGNAQTRDARFHVEATETDPFQDVLGLAMSAWPVHQPPEAAGGHLPHQDVLRDGEVGHQTELLIDGADAQFVRPEGAVYFDQPIVEQNPARVALDCPGQNLDQRGLARPVLSDNGVHFPGDSRKINGSQRLSALVAFADLSHLEQRWLCHPLLLRHSA